MLTALKTLVIVMTTLLALGLGVLVWGIAFRGSGAKPQPPAPTTELPPVLTVVDPASGRTLGTYVLTPAAPKNPLASKP